MWVQSRSALCEVRFCGKCSSLWSGCHCAVTPKSLRPLWPWSSESAVSGWRHRVSRTRRRTARHGPWRLGARGCLTRPKKSTDGGSQGLTNGAGLHVSPKGCRWNGLPVWLTTLFRFATWLLMRMLLWFAKRPNPEQESQRPSRSFVILKEPFEENEMHVSLKLETLGFGANFRSAWCLCLFVAVGVDVAEIGEA